MSLFQPEGGWNVYNSYVTDPHYRTLMLYGFTGLLGAATLINAPVVLRHLSAVQAGLRRRLRHPSKDHSSGDGYKTGGYAGPAGRLHLGAESGGRPPSPLRSLYIVFASVTQSLWMPSLPLPRLHRRRAGYLTLSAGNIYLVLLMAGIILASLLPEQQLLTNANRLGFLSLGLLPIIFLLSMKALNPLVILLGKGYEKLNFLHRWLGRFMLVLILAHASLWINSWRKVSSQYTLSMLRQDKQVYGLLALAFLTLLAFSSLRPIRNYSYSLFFTLHVLGYVGLIVGVSYHTPYSRNWAGVAVSAIYAVDLLGRLVSFKFREIALMNLKDTSEAAYGDRDEDGVETGMTRIAIRDSADRCMSWKTGQFVSLRIFFSPPTDNFSVGRTWTIRNPFQTLESHPFTIAQAPPHVSILSEHQDLATHGVRMYCRASSRHPGEWSAALHAYVSSASTAHRQLLSSGRSQRDDRDNEVSEYLLEKDGISATAFLEGPYGAGLEGFAPERDETVLLIACGSGMSFVIATLDDIVGRCVRGFAGARTRRVEVVWVVRHTSQISWFACTLIALQEAAHKAGVLSIHLKVHVTCTSYDNGSISGSDGPKCRCNDFRAATAEGAAAVADSAGEDKDLECCCVGGPSYYVLRHSKIPVSTASSLPDAAFGAASTASNSLSSSSGRGIPASNIEIAYSRPSLPALLRGAISRSVEPCKTCAGNCKCATQGGQGVCGCRKIEAAMKREVQNEMEKEMQMNGTRWCCSGTSTRSVSAISTEPAAGDADAIAVLPALSRNQTGGSQADAAETEKSCCGKQAPAPTLATKHAQAAPTAKCCSSAMPVTESKTAFDSDTSASSGDDGDTEILTGGLAVIACGPRTMLAELGNAMARLPIKDRVKIGGVRYYREGFEL